MPRVINDTEETGQKAAVAPLPAGPPSAQEGPWTAPPDVLLRLRYPPLLTSFCCVQRWGVLGAVWSSLAAWRSPEVNVSSVPAPSLVRPPRSPPLPAPDPRGFPSRPRAACVAPAQPGLHYPDLQHPPPLRLSVPVSLSSLLDTPGGRFDLVFSPLT